MDKYRRRTKTKKLQGPVVVKNLKRVRINAFTEIMVDVNTPDEDAIDRYYERHKMLRNRNIPPLTLEEADEKPELVPAEQVILPLDDTLDEE